MGGFQVVVPLGWGLTGKMTFKRWRGEEQPGGEWGIFQFRGVGQLRGYKSQHFLFFLWLLKA